jgi:hypothetical protein
VSDRGLPIVQLSVGIGWYALQRFGSPLILLEQLQEVVCGDGRGLLAVGDLDETWALWHPVGLPAAKENVQLSGDRSRRWRS